MKDRALQQARMYLSSYQGHQDALAKRREQRGNTPTSMDTARELATTYALISIAEALHHLSDVIEVKG